MAYDIATPYAVSKEIDKIKEHFAILKNEVVEDIKIGGLYGLISKELTHKEKCQLVSVVLYGGNDNCSDEIFEIGKDIYKYISEFKRV